MTPAPIAFNLKKLKGSADWKLLLFLVLFLDVKLAVKLFAIALIYLLNFDFKFGFKLKGARLTLFYPLIILLAIIGYLLNGRYTNLNYNLVFITVLGFWLMCILAIHQIKLAIERNTVAVINQTIIIFFIINTAVSLLNIGAIILHTHALNPFTYQGEYQKYFISTGDFIKGLMFDSSITNSVINAFGVIYFLSRKNFMMTLVCMCILLLTASNFINLLVIAVLGLLFVFKSNRDQKSVIVVCFGFLVVFMAKISPQNNDYALNTIKTAIYKKPVISPWLVDNTVRITLRPDSTLTPEEKRIKTATLYIDSLYKTHPPKAIRNKLPAAVVTTPTGKIILPKPNLNLPAYQWLRSTPKEQIQLHDFVTAHEQELPISKTHTWSPTPGKLTGMKQTVDFFKQHPAKIFFGEGVGNFSSKLAFKATGLNFTGGYPKKYVYINPDFLRNHLDVYLSFFSRGPGTHSLTNSPFSVYDQLLSEYGLLGLLALFIFYLWFFARHYKKLTYGIPLLILLLSIFFIDYWFEQLSVVVLFELLLFLDIKESQLPLTPKTVIK
ncbi:hypothetical protein [Mucilaginibacter sp. UYCu711]|uniref:hypothetical protein n=1 Tax=Mucilaginibacter sp. UYCu711 TaxID=3156339 RepID=UPI003D2242E8